MPRTSRRTSWYIRDRDAPPWPSRRGRQQRLIRSLQDSLEQVQDSLEQAEAKFRRAEASLRGLVEWLSRLTRRVALLEEQAFGEAGPAPQTPLEPGV